MADILISQLPKTNQAGDQDLLIIDSFDSSTGGIVTNAIRWGDLYQKISQLPQTIMFADGTALQPSITFIQDQNTGIYRQGNDTIGFTTAGLPRMVINQEGNIGVNTLTPTQKFELANGNLQVTFGISNALRISAGAGGALVEQVYNLPLAFATNGQERMRISPLGNLLINTDDDVQNVRLNVAGGTLQVQNASFTGVSGGVVKLGYNTGVDKGLFYVNYAGAIAPLNQDYGTPGQVLVSQGPGSPFTWGANQGGGGDPGGGTNPGPNPPGTPNIGDLWYDTTSNILYVFNGTGWDPVWDGSTQPGPNPPTGPNEGDLWYNDIENKLYYWDGSAWVEVGSGSGSGSVTSIDIAEGVGISSTGGPITDAGSITVGLKPLGVDPSGTYSVPNIAVDEYGRVTSASDGTAGDLPPIALNDLSDVNAPSPTDEYFLQWNGSEWVAADVPVPDAVTYKGSIDLLVDPVPLNPDNGDLYINTGVGTISNDNWGVDNNGKVLTGAESVYYNAGNSDWDIISTGDPGVVSVVEGTGIDVNDADPANPVVSLDTTYIDDPNNNFKNVQSNWTETDPGDDSFIQNKPDLGSLAEFDDAPTDGKKYTRQSEAWVEETRNSNAGNSPPADPVIGLLWYDTDVNGDKILKIYDGVSFVEIDRASGTAPVYVSDSAPSSAVEGDLWYETDTDVLYVRVGATWEPVGGNGVEAGPIEPPDKVPGTLWYDTNNDKLYVWTGTEWEEIVTQDPNDPDQFVDLTTDQTIDGKKTFLQEIDGVAKSVNKNITVGDGLNGGGTLTQDLTIALDIGDGLAFEGVSPDSNLVAKAGDDTILVDAGGIKVNVAHIYDPINKFSVISFNGRKGAVLPAENDYSINMLSDVDTSAEQENYVLTKRGTQWIAAEIQIPGSLKLRGTIDATLQTAPVSDPGDYWVNTQTGAVLSDVSWGVLQGVACSDGDLIAKLEEIGGQPIQWAIIGNSGAGSGGVNSVQAQNGVVNTGTAGAVVLEADDTVLRTSGAQEASGIKTFTDGIIADVTGDLTGTAQKCAKSVLAGEGLSGGGELTADITLDVAHDDSLKIESDLLSVNLGPGLEVGDDGIVIIEGAGGIGNGNIEHAVGPNGGIELSGDLTSTANQVGDTLLTMSVDNTVVRTEGDQDIEGIKTVANYVIATNGNFDFSSLAVLP